MGCNCHECNHTSEGHSCIAIVPIFNSLTPEEMDEIATITDAQTFDKGDLVYMAGDKVGKLYVLHTGSIKISRINLNGKEQVIRIVGPGDFFGELSLFTSSTSTDNGEVLEKSTMCVIENTKLKELMKKYPAISFKIMEELSRRLENAESLIENINLNSVEERLAQALLNLSKDKDVVLLNTTKGNFASQIGMSQETLSRKLTAFQDSGFIELQGQRKIKILDREGLEDIL